MFIVKNKNIIDSQYYSLIIYLYQRCDMVSFCLPDFFNKVVTDENKDAFPPGTSLGIYRKESNENFKAYKQSIVEEIEDSGIKPYIIHKYNSVEYCESIRAYNSEIYYISFVENTIGYFMAGQGLFNWQYPNLPEDVCFYRKGKCLLRSIAHERLCELYIDDSEELNYLRKKVKLKLIQIQSDHVPAASYTISYYTQGI